MGTIQGEGLSAEIVSGRAEGNPRGLNTSLAWDQEGLRGDETFRRVSAAGFAKVGPVRIERPRTGQEVATVEGAGP